jgi:RNA polymerase sigma factor (TIGR02999 family)
MHPLDVTHVLESAARGDPAAPDRLLPVVYDELRRLAAQALAGERPGHTLQATALVHEAYLRMVGPAGQQRWENRRHFFGAAAEAMRRILVDSARRRNSQKRGGGARAEPLDALQVAAPEPRDDLLAVHEALDALVAADPAAAELVKLRYFVGLSIPQAAEVLGVSPRSADRLWAYARAWLHQRIGAGT